ncbi:MAG: PQQ-binding-like beta-propeller repeat protein [Pirellulaceae bacterium]
MPGDWFRRVALMAAAGYVGCCVVEAPAADWPTFRGANRSAVAPDVNLLDSWPEKGPRLVWKSAGAGRGYSSLAISGGRIYTLGDGPSTAQDEDEYLSCFDAKSGQPVWSTRTGPPWVSGNNDWQSSRSTPTVDGDRVWVITPHGELICCNATTGVEQWRKHLKKDFGGNKADGWGYSESPLVDGDRVVVTPGGERNTVVALNKHTGETEWSAVREGDRGAGHASIVPTEIGGTRVYVQTTGSGGLGIRATDGKLLWSYPFSPTTAVIPTPIVRGDLVFLVAGYGRGGALLRQVVASKGEVRIEEVYPLNPRHANKHGGVVLVGDYLYGDTEDRGTPYCADLLTGEVKWTQRGSGRGSASIVAADGKLFIRYANGTMTMANASPDGLSETGSFTIPESGARPGWAHPVIVDGKLYLREQDVLLCYDLRQTDAAE